MFIFDVFTVYEHRTANTLPALFNCHSMSLTLLSEVFQVKPKAFNITFQTKCNRQIITIIRMNMNIIFHTTVLRHRSHNAESPQVKKRLKTGRCLLVQLL